MNTNIWRDFQICISVPLILLKNFCEQSTTNFEKDNLNYYSIKPTPKPKPKPTL